MVATLRLAPHERGVVGAGLADLLGGLNDQTALVRMVQIRTESDPERLKDFNADQRRIRADWQRRRALKRPESDTRSFLDQIQGGFKRLFGEDSDAGG